MKEAGITVRGYWFDGLLVYNSSLELNNCMSLEATDKSPIQEC